MQRMAKTLLFFYPAVRWLSNRLRHERECRCDELAAEAAGNCRTYASALEYAGRDELATNRPVLAVGLGHYKMAILARVRHALGISSPPKWSRYWLAGVLTPAAVITLGIGAQIAVTGSDVKLVTPGKPVEEFNPAKAAIPAQNSFQGITVSIRAKKSIYEPGSILEIVGTISTDREHTMYNAYWDPKKPVPGRLFVYDEAGNQILELYDPRHHIGSSTGATKSACRKYKPGETQQIFLRQCLLFDRSADRPLPPGRYKVQLALNGLLLWEPREYVAHDEVPQELDRQMVAYSNVVHIEIKGEPAFQPKTLTQWIEALKHGSPKVRYSAAWTLREMKDPRAVAPLIESLKDEDHKVRYLATEALAAIGKPAVDSLIVALKEKDTQVRICAARALERIADKRSMAPLIVALKEDQNREVRSSAARALGNIRDKNAVPVLIEALRDKDIHPQITVCCALRKIGKPAINSLIFHLKDTDKQARIRVAKALAEIADKRSTEALVGALRDENPEVRSLAARGLGRIKARSAVPALIEALKADEVPGVRSSAARALGQTKGPGAVAALTAALKDKDVARSAWWALAEIGKPAVEHLIIALKDTDLQVRLSAAKALASIVDKKSLEPLIDALRDENAEVRVLAAETLGKLEDERAVMPLTARLNDKDVRVRKGVILALGKIKDDRAVEPIIAVLRDEMPSIRSCAARGLGMIRDKRAVEPLIPLLKDSKDSEAAYYTAWALGEIGDKRAVEPLIACLNYEIQHPSVLAVLAKAAEALGKIKDERAVEPLMTALKVTRPNIPMPRSLVGSWAKPTDEAYLSYLIMILEDDYKAPRQYAVAWALVEIGQPAIGPLTGALQSDDKWLSGAAAVILEKIQAAPPTEPSTGMKSQQGKVEKQLAWLASEADVVVVAENPWQYDRLYARQVLKGSKVSFSNIQEIDGIEKPPTDKNKQWILFLRIEQDHNLLLSPVTPGGWFAPYSGELAQRVVAAIPLPETWGETRDGLRMGLRLRKSDFDVGEDIPVEICIQNVSKKAVTLYQHRYNNREYDYYPFTRLVVEFSDGRRLELYKPTLVISDMDSPSPRTLSPGETYIHTVNLSKWTDWYEPAPKPGEKAELFTPGTYKITCTYSVGEKPDYVHPWNPPKNAWFGTLTSAPITLKIVEAKDASAATQPTVTERYDLNDMPADIRKEIEKLHSPDARIRALAAMALGEMGPKAGPAIPHLIRLLGDRATFDHRDVWQKATFFTIGGRSFGAYVAAEATGALAKIGEPAVKPLIEALKDSNAFVRVHAARALERIQDKRAVEPLCDVLKDADENVRSAAAIALGQIGDGRAAKPLTELLADKAFRPRQDAIDALIKLDRLATKPVLTALRDWRRRGSASYILAKTRDPDAVEPLLDDLKDPNHNVRQGAVVGLGALGDRRAVKPLVKLLKDPNPHVRAASVRALGSIGEIPLEVYKRALQDEEPQVRINAAMALRKTKDTGATEILVKALKDENSSVRNEVLLTLSGIRDFRAVPAIIELLRDEDEGIRANAAFVLAQFKDQRAVNPLMKALNDKDANVRARATYALGEIKDPRAVDVLCKALGDEKPEVRVRAAMALRNIGDKRAVVPLIDALKDPDWEVVIRTTEALGIIGDTQAVEPLILVLTDELKNPRKINIVRNPVRESTDDLPWAGTDMTVTLPVIAALGWLGDERATQPLLTALNDKRFQIRLKVAEALGNIRAQAAVAALIAVLKDEESSVRSSAARALGQIKDPRAIEALIAASQDKEVSASAISALRSITGHPDYTWEQWQRWWQKNRDKWIRSAKEAAGRRVVKETVKYLQMDDKKVEVNWTLRIVTMEDYESKWFLRRENQEKEEYIGSNFAAMSELYDIKAALNGRYLAVLSIGEGVQMLEVVDLPLLLMGKKYKVLRTIDPFPGGVAIEHWDGGRLVITSGALLTYIGEDGRVPHPSLGWMSPQKYALSVESGGIEALSEGAKNPVEYFIRKLSSSHPGERQDAAMALKELKVRSAIGALKKAVTVESDPGGRAFMREIVDELEKLPKGGEKPPAVLRWVDDETGQMLFTVRDIVRFDWEQQIFELSRRRAMDLLANQNKLSRRFTVRDDLGVIYHGTFVSSAASMTFDGPVIVVNSIIKNIQPPLFRIDGGYHQGPERDEIRFSKRMKMALAEAGVLCEIDLTRPPTPFTRIMSEWAGEKEGPRVLVELFPETFQIGEMARIHVHFAGGKHLSEDAHAIKVNATVKANNGEFEYTVQRIFPIGRDGWKKVYVLESMPWGPVLASPDAYAKPGPAEVSVQVSTRKILDTKKGTYSDIIDAIKVKPIKVTILPRGPVTQAAGVEIGKRNLRIELYDKDAVKPGLLPIGLYDACEYPGAKWIYVQATKGQIPRGYNQLVGRMGGPYSRNDEIEVTEYKREGNRITAHIRYIRSKPEGSHNKVVYLLADIPQNLPPGRYNVVITLAEYLREGGKIIFAPKSAIRAFEQLTCTFDVPASHVAQPTDTKSDESWLTYVDAKRHFRFQYPKRWKLTSGNVCWHHYFDGFLSLNNFDKEDFWLSNIDAPLGGQDAPLLTELPPGAAYIDMSWFGFPPLGYADDNVLRVLGEMKAQDIAGALERSTEEILENGQIRFRYISFIKWRREWCIRVYLREPVGEANRKVLDHVLRSFRFDAFPVGDELWAVALAREHLWPEEDPNLFPLRGSKGYREVHTEKKGDEVIVTFTEVNRQREPQKLWKFRVTADGDVIALPSTRTRLRHCLQCYHDITGAGESKAGAKTKLIG